MRQDATTFLNRYHKESHLHPSLFQTSWPDGGHIASFSLHAASSSFLCPLPFRAALSILIYFLSTLPQANLPRIDHSHQPPSVDSRLLALGLGLSLPVWPMVMDVHRRNPDIHYVDPQKELNVGLWTLYAGATAFLAARIWSKSILRRHGLWYDDYILLVAWVILTANDIIITMEYATGYVSHEWNDRMHILINISSCGTLLGQSLTKAAFAVTLLKLTRGFSHWKACHYILWFCIVTMCSWNLAKIFVEWGRVCNSPSYDVHYRFQFCVEKHFRSKFKEGGNYYNIVMDFVFAAFPWVITYGLDMERKEKIGLCLTMSLGMVVAIESAIRTEWKFDGNEKDEWYFWRNAMSNIWYSSEITGTIIVQCIPVLRPLVQDIHTSLRSKRLGSAIDEVALEHVEPHWYHAK